MTPDDPRHGKTAGATAHYKADVPLCGPCRDARRTYSRRTAKNRRRGWRGLVPVGPARTHILGLRDTGMTWDQIGDATGLTRSTVYRLAGLDRPVDLIRNSTSAKALAARPLTNPDPAFVPLFRVRRRLQALQALGWSLTEIGGRCGWNSRNLLALLRDNSWRPRETVSSATFAKVDAVYRELCMVLPPFNRSTSGVRNRAARSGWVPPLAWMDIDDADEKPARVRKSDSKTSKTDVDPVVVDRVLAGDRLPITYAERREIVRRAKALGWSEDIIHRRTGIAKATDPSRFGVAS